MFIAIEGGDGTGKSTLTTQLANKLGGRAYATPPHKYRKYRDEVDRTSPPKEHYDYYRDSILDASEEIRELMSQKNCVVCDRYWISTVTYHEVMGVSVNLDDFKEIVRPDVTILLVASPNEQIRRMVARGMSAGDKRMLDQQREISLGFFRNLTLTNTPFISIDTGRFSVDESIRIVSSICI